MQKLIPPAIEASEMTFCVYSTLEGWDICPIQIIHWIDHHPNIRKWSYQSTTDFRLLEVKITTVPRDKASTYVNSISVVSRYGTSFDTACEESAPQPECRPASAEARKSSHSPSRSRTVYQQTRTKPPARTLQSLLRFVRLDLHFKISQEHLTPTCLP